MTKERPWEKWNELGILEELEAVWKTDMWIVSVIRRSMPAIAGRVLDVGCGTGRASSIFTNEQYVGIDTEPVMLKRAKELYPSKRFEFGDAYHLNFKNNEFELVLCNAVLHHIPQLEPALAELWRVTDKYLLASFIVGQKNECAPQWRGFLSHVVTFDRMMQLVHNLNPRPHRITVEYLDLWAHGSLAFIEKQRRPDLPNDALGIQW